MNNNAKSSPGLRDYKDQRKIAAAQRQQQALELRRAGTGYVQIAEALGYASHSGARQAVKLGLKATLREPADEVRQLAVERLDRALRAVWPRVLTGDDAAIATMLRIEKRRADLLGLDAPTRTELTGRDGGPIELVQRPAYDFSLLSDEELEALQALGQRISTGQIDPVMVAQLADLIDYVPTELAERRLKHFVRNAWHVIEPFAPFAPSWHLDAIADHLEAVDAGQIRNLLVTMPPRMGKSLTISVFYPAWTWIRKPGLRFLYASYSQDLATDHSLGTRRVIESPWYQQRWADRFRLAGDANLKTRFENDHRGARIATSVGGVATGRGGDRIIVDDAHNVMAAESEAVRVSTLTWWDQAMSTRFNDPKTGARIVVMQRVHQDDLAGHVLEQGGYTHLNLPMEYEPGETHWTGFGMPDPRTEPGELLAPGRFSDVENAMQKTILGARGYAGQYQQRPTPLEGGTFKREWWQRYVELPKLTKVEQFLDSAFKTGVANDFSVIATWGSDGAGNLYVIDLWRKRVEYPDLIHAVHRQHAKHNEYGVSVPVVIEDKASGQSAIQTLARPHPTTSGETLPRLPVVAFPIPAGESKESRAEGVSPVVEGRRVFLPVDADWVEDFIEEHALFPAATHDDQVDTTSMAIKRLGRVRAGMGWV